MLSVLLFVFFALAHGAVSSIRGQCGGVAAGLQVVEQLVSCGELVVTRHTSEDYFLLQVYRGRRNILLEYSLNNTKDKKGKLKL